MISSILVWKVYCMVRRSKPSRKVGKDHILKTLCCSGCICYHPRKPKLTVEVSREGIMANAGDPNNRKSSQLSRLRQQLRKKKEALADHFDYRMYMIFHFKEKMKPCAMFEIAEVVPVMTNNYEESILKGAKDEAYSYESTLELLEKDVVQLHAPRWQSMRKDILGCTTEIDFFLWPRSDILRIECRLFSKWKGDADDSFKPIQGSFEFISDDYEKQLIRLLTRKEKTGLIINNPTQSMFLFVDRQHLETAKRKAIVFKLSSVCLYLPQDQLTNWGAGDCNQILDNILNAPLRDDVNNSDKLIASRDAALSSGSNTPPLAANGVLETKTLTNTSQCGKEINSALSPTNVISSDSCTHATSVQSEPLSTAASSTLLTVACKQSSPSSAHNTTQPVLLTPVTSDSVDTRQCSDHGEELNNVLLDDECCDNAPDSSFQLSFATLSLS